MQTNASVLQNTGHPVGSVAADAALEVIEPDWHGWDVDACIERGVLPVRSAKGAQVLLRDARPGVLNWLRRQRPGGVRWTVASEAELKPYWDAVRRAAAVQEADQARSSDDASVPMNVTDYVDTLVRTAWRSRASDIHLEHTRHGLTARYRVDGLLTPAQDWTGTEAASEVLSRLKVLAALDISETRLPQDGRYTASIDGLSVDIRVSIMPNAYGECAVLRILDKRHLLGQAQQITLEGLGYQGTSLGRIRALARRPHGMLLVTGPTGSGKTTTLYATIAESMSPQDKIISIEDPIEYEIDGLLQIPVNEKKGLTFAKGLRSILRHDPDKIFVGEIRDAETADIAVQAALTGHLVFTTVHANSVFDVIGRFLHMGVDLYSFMSSLNGVVSQRLVRRSCACAPAVRMGCTRCGGSGFDGRTVLAEVLEVDDRLRDMVVARADLSQVKAYVHERVGVAMARQAAEMVAQCITTQEEVDRVLVVEA
jgi:general secretion pathway protein E